MALTEFRRRLRYWLAAKVCKRTGHVIGIHVPSTIPAPWWDRVWLYCRRCGRHLAG